MKPDPPGTKLSRRQFATCAAAAAAGFLLTGCGPRPPPRNAARAPEGRHPRDGAPLRAAVRTGSNGVRCAAAAGRRVRYALDISRCIGCRRCVYACVEENNQSRDPQVQWIRVFEMEKGKGVDFSEADPYYAPPEVPEDGHFYVPVQCQQCRNAPCTKVCPTGATWTEPDGIVVVDYDWCIGCRYCMAACPYGARHFNWGKPTIPTDELNTKTHVLGNRPGRRGWSRSAPSASSERATAIPGMRRDLPGRGEEVWQPARPRQRDSLHHRAQACARAQGRTQHASQVLLLLRDVRLRVDTVRLFSQFVGAASAVLRGPCRLLVVAGLPAVADRLGGGGLPGPGAGRSDRDRHA